MAKGGSGMGDVDQDKLLHHLRVDTGEVTGHNTTPVMGNQHTLLIAWIGNTRELPHFTKIFSLAVSSPNTAN